MIKVSGISIDDDKKEHIEAKQLLSAITIQHLPETNKLYGAIIGTRINVHLSLIMRFLPGLIDI